jgi:putative aldouronate transport system permease protein
MFSKTDQLKWQDRAAIKNGPGILPRLRKYFIENGTLYLFALPGLIFLLLFCYVPLSGLVLVFKNYNFQDGIYGSPWVGFDNFNYFFSSFDSAWRATRNTLVLNSMFIFFGTVFAVTLGIMFNEIKSKVFIKITQSITFLPNFLSWVVLGGIFMTILDYDKGAFNQFIASLGLERIDFNAEPLYWPFILSFENIWKGAGYSSIVYFAVLTNLDPAYYESAVVDGATRFQKIRYISLPQLKPTIIILTLLAVGRIFYGDLGMIMGATSMNPMLFSTTDVIDSYVYRSAVKNGEFSMASAVGLYQSLFGFLLVMGSNYFAGRFDKDYKIF